MKAHNGVSILYFAYTANWLGSGKGIANSSVDCGPQIFWQVESEELKGNRDPCTARKSIESDYLEREQVGSQGGPCHMHTLSTLLSLAP